MDDDANPDINRNEGDPNKLVDDIPENESVERQEVTVHEGNDNIPEEHFDDHIVDDFDDDRCDDDIIEESLSDDIQESKEHVEIDSESFTPKESLLSKLCKLCRRPKVHTLDDESSVVSVFEAKPPLPENMPSSADFRARIEYRNQRLQYGAQKIEFYLNQMENGSLNIDDLMMKSSFGMQYTEKL